MVARTLADTQNSNALIAALRQTADTLMKDSEGGTGGWSFHRMRQSVGKREKMDCKQVLEYRKRYPIVKLSTTPI